MIVSGQSMEIPVQSLLNMLETTVSQYPDKRATVFMGHEMTYRELLQSVQLLMGQLQLHGVQSGDRVGIMLPNCPQYLVAYYAITGLGATVVQVNPLSTGPELEFLLNDSGCQRLFAFEQFLPVIQSVKSLTQLTMTIAVRFGPSNASLGEPDVWFDEWLATSTGPATTVPFDPLETVAVLQYTGGTTGRPKGAMLTHQNLVANAFQSKSLLTATNEDMMVCALPLFHVYAMTVCMNYSVVSGMSMLIIPRFHPVELLDQIRTYQPTLFPAVPTMFVALSQVVQPGSDVLKCLRGCNSGGAPLPEKVMEEFERITGAVITEGYGLSEASPVSHANPSGNRKVGSIGVPAPNTEARIVSLEDGTQVLPMGEVGELAIRGPQVMKGYWNRPEETAQTIVDGWLLTGDIAKMDEDGYAYIVDRKKDMIIASGYNVYPRDVEEALYMHPAVLEAAVIGVPDDYRGENVKAFIVFKAGQTATVDDIQTWCRERLAAYKIPREIEFRDELPKTAVGKILRRALRQTS